MYRPTFKKNHAITLHCICQGRITLGPSFYFGAPFFQTNGVPGPCFFMPHGSLSVACPALRKLTSLRGAKWNGLHGLWSCVWTSLLLYTVVYKKSASFSGTTGADGIMLKVAWKSMELAWNFVVTQVYEPCIPDNPCLVCEGLTAEQRARSIQARALRLRRQARRAGSAGSVSGSSPCGPVEGKAFGPLGSTPEPSVKGQGGMGLTSPRSVVSRDGGRGSPSAASLSSVAADDGDTGRNTSLGPRSQDGGSGGVRSSYPPLRGAAEALSRQAFRRRSRTPVRLRHSSESSLDAYAYATVLPTGAARTGPDRTRTGPGPDRTGPGMDRTGPGMDRTGPGMDRTGPGMDRTGPGPDRTGSSWFPGPGKDLSERRDASKVDRRSRARKRGQRDASLSSSSSSVSEYRRESRRDRHRRRNGRSRRRYRSVTPPQAATLATEQILRAIADVKRATDAVVARVDSLERGGAVSAGASPLPSVAEQDISLVPAQDDFLSSDEEGSREWRPRHGGGETPSEVVAVAREGVTTASRSTPLEAESIDSAPPPLGMPTLTAIGIRSRQCLPIIPTSHPNHFPWMMCLEGS